MSAEKSRKLYLERQLPDFWPLVRLVAGERYQALQRGDSEWHTTYDRFLWWAVGDPHSGDRGEVIKQRPNGEHYRYDDAVAQSYSSKGVLAMVRRSSGKKSLDTGRYLVATADLARQSIEEWQVSKINLSGQLGNRCMTLLLSEHHLHAVPDEPPGDPEELFPRFELKAEGNRFVDQFGKCHSLAPLAELVEMVDYAWPFIKEYPQVVESYTASALLEQLDEQAA